MGLGLVKDESIRIGGVSRCPSNGLEGRRNIDTSVRTCRENYVSTKCFEVHAEKIYLMSKNKGHLAKSGKK